MAAVVGIPLVLLAVVEAALRLSGFGYAPDFFLKAQINGQPVWIENQKFSRRFFPTALVRHPQPTLMNAVKSPEICRIFLLGESAAMGDPAPAFGLARVLEKLLEDRFPGLRFEVVNTAITAINSNVILPIARDCARQNGDFWVVYMGNNEVVGPFGAGTVFGSQTLPLWMIRFNLATRTTRLGQLLAAGLDRLRPASEPQSWGGMTMFLNQQVRQREARMERVYAHFERNLRDIIRLGVASGAQVLVSSMAANLKDCAPFSSLHSPDLTATQLSAWEQQVQEGAKLAQATNYQAALSCFERALQIDPEYADLHYQAAQCLRSLRQVDEARRHFEQARDLDTLRFRADRRINEIISHSAAAFNAAQVCLVEGAEAIAWHSPDHLPGDELLYEHVHFNYDGNYWLGLAMAEAIASRLPAALRQRSQDRGQWLAVEDCAQRLALTDWDRLQGVEAMLKRMSEPPFINQSDYALRRQRWTGRLNQLRPHGKPYALRRTIEVYRRAVEERPKDWHIRANFARALQSASANDAALEQWRACLSQVPHHASALYGLGNLLDTMGKSAEAQACFRDALRIRPEFPEALNSLGLCLVNQGRLEEAARAYRQAVALSPDFAEGFVNLGLVLLKLGQTPEAMAQYERALRIKPGSVAAHLNLGKALAGLDRLEEARQHYAAAVDLAPDDATAQYNLANLLARQAQGEAAISHYQTAVQLNPDFIEARLNLGLELARAGRRPAAITELAEAVRRRPSRADARYNLGVALAQERRYAEAVAQFQETLRLEPENTRAQKSLEAAQALIPPGR